MATAQWAWKELNLDFPLESLLLVSLLIKRVTLLEVLIELLLLRIPHIPWKIQIGLLLLIVVHVLLLLIKVSLLNCIECLVTRLELSSSLRVLESSSGG